MTLPQIRSLNVGQSLNAFSQGEQLGIAAQKRGTLQHAGQLFAQGNLSGAQKVLAESGEVGSAIDLAKFSIGQRKQLADQIAAAAVQADSPEKWSAMLQTLRQRGVPEQDLAPFQDFNSRPTAISQALSASEALKLELDRAKSNDTATLKNLRAAGIDPASPEGRAIIAGKGTTNITVNTGDNVPVTKAEANKLQSRITSDTEILASLDDVSRSFQPEFQELGTRFSNLVTSFKSKAGIKVDPQDRKQLRDFSRFKSRSINVINTRLNQLSGAAVSPAEAVRIRKGLPDPGDGLFDGDDPISFKSKLDTAMLDIRRSIARRNWALRNGISEKPWEAFDLSEMDRIMSDREAELRTQLQQQNPNLDPATTDAEIAAIMSKEFGIPLGE